MHSYQCLQKGIAGINNIASAYNPRCNLATLRKLYLLGQIGVEQFCLDAANTYIAVQKPMRAIALINSLIPNANSLFVNNLLKQAYEMSQKVMPYCSLNMIVKNEEAKIGEALDSVDDLVDEIVVCDTGSTDKTIEIASLYGCKIIYDEWKNDFSKARNKALASSVGKCIFWMDADDKLEEHSRDFFSTVLQKALKNPVAVCVANGKNETTGSEFLQVRFFPRRPEIYFERRIHEQLLLSINRANITVDKIPQLKIIHTGYSDPLVHKAKAMRNLPLIMQELEKFPQDPSLMLSLGDCYTIVGKFDEALNVYLQIASSNIIAEVHIDVYLQAHINIGNLMLSRNLFSEAREYLYKALALDTTRIDAIYLIALSYWKEKIFNKAFNHFLQCCKINPPIRSTACDIRMIKMQSFFYLCDILLKLGKYEDAERTLDTLLRLYPNVVEYYSQMGDALYGQRRLFEAVKYYCLGLVRSQSQNPNAYLGVARIYMDLGESEKAKHYLTLALDNNSASAEIYKLLSNSTV